MPKRSTNFQELVELLERQLAPTGAFITASKLLADARSGEEREVDIVIETQSGIHPLVIGIEVIEHKRPISSPWVEGIAKKHEDLPIDKTLVVSRSGFYKPAIAKAIAYKIDALTLEQASELDWKAKIDRIPAVKIVSFLLPYLTAATVVFTNEESMKEFEEIELRDIEIYTPRRESRGSLQSVLDRLILDKDFIDAISAKAFTDTDTVVDGKIQLQKGSYVVAENDTEHVVHSLKFQAKCKREEADAELLKGRYRDTAVVLASGDSFGRPVQMVFTESNDDKDPVASVRVKVKRH